MKAEFNRQDSGEMGAPPWARCRALFGSVPAFPKVLDSQRNEKHARGPQRQGMKRRPRPTLVGPCPSGGPASPGPIPPVFPAPCCHMSQDHCQRQTPRSLHHPWGHCCSSHGHCFQRSRQVFRDTWLPPAHNTRHLSVALAISFLQGPL